MKRLVLILIGLATAGTTLAQQRYFYANLNGVKPLGNSEWVDDFSFSGGKVGYRVFVCPNISAGLDIGWGNFDQYEPKNSKQNGTNTITSDYFHYTYNYSAAASGQYYFRDDEDDRFFAYAGLGLGASTNEYVLYYNIYEDSERSWGFLARPEVGVLFRFTHHGSFGVMATVHYDYSTNKSEKFANRNFTGLGFQIGVMTMSF